MAKGREQGHAAALAAAFREKLKALEAAWARRSIGSWRERDTMLDAAQADCAQTGD